MGRVPRSPSVPLLCVGNHLYNSTQGRRQLWTHTMTQPTRCHHQCHHSDGKSGTDVTLVSQIGLPKTLQWKETLSTTAWGPCGIKPVMRRDSMMNWLSGSKWLNYSSEHSVAYPPHLISHLARTDVSMWCIWRSGLTPWGACVLSHEYPKTKSSHSIGDRISRNTFSVFSVYWQTLTTAA